MIQVNFWLKYAEVSYLIYTLKLIAGFMRKIHDRNAKSDIMIKWLKYAEVSYLIYTST